MGRAAVFDLDREASSFHVHDRAIAQEPGHRLGVKRGRHDNDDQVGTNLPADLTQKCQRQVAMQAALVELVEHDGADFLEERIGQELPVEDALGLDSQSRASARSGVPSAPGSQLPLPASSSARARSARPSIAPRPCEAGARSLRDDRPRAGRNARWPAAPASFCPPPAARRARGPCARECRRECRAGCHRWGAAS